MGKVVLEVNGAVREVEADSATPLIYVLRNGLGLMGAKLGCGLEQCGACAVIADGEKVLSCVRAVSEFEGRAIVTVEGLAQGGELNRVQRAFLETGAAQCGYCTAGLVVALTAYLETAARPDRKGAVEALEGHLCRCGAHADVLRAVDRLLAGAADGT
ncbi:MAG: (2Fe-2S)-binding protein [Alphaproteobacteria bacterium]|nr:(2Fe-2S)-binding protein [Alphaproteobacteria bacterium]